jgi:chromosome segregation ATPase
MYKPNVLTVWVYILCHVEYQPTDVIFEGKRLTLQAGQGLFKFYQVAQELGIAVTTLHRIVETLKNEKQIEKQSSPRNTVITVVNWEKYQAVGKQNEKQTENKRKTNEKQTENLPINKKNLRNKEIKNVYGTYQNVFLTDEDFQKLKNEFTDWQDRLNRLSEYIASTGKKYKDHLATIRSWARRDKENGHGTNQLGGQANRNESNLAAIEEAVRTAEARRKAGTMGTVQAGGHPADQGVRTTYPWQRPKV